MPYTKRVSVSEIEAVDMLRQAREITVGNCVPPSEAFLYFSRLNHGTVFLFVVNDFAL